MCVVIHSVNLNILCIYDLLHIPLSLWHTYVCMCVHTYVRLCVYLYVCMCVCVCLYKWINTYIYIYKLLKLKLLSTVV